MTAQSPRAQALLGYFATIVFDPKVSAAKTFDDYKRAVIACVLEDLAAVGKIGLRGGAEMFIRRAAPAANEIFQGLLDRVLGAK